MKDNLLKTKELSTAIPQIAKSKAKINKLYEKVSRIETKHIVYKRDARDLSFLEDESIQLAITSPPYWNLKKYDDFEEQLGTSSRFHPAPYPKKITGRQVRMFSFVGDTVLDPYVGSGTTMLSCCDYGRNSISLDINPNYLKKAYKRLRKNIDLLNNVNMNLLHFKNTSYSDRYSFY